ncbi:unnamed protein product [Symbiodinium natans]|uniref:Uncharacterized protein n=1 Tax=Symbiodinium natans TaxID=878477 RepID=A0A812JSH1_9DINO|nr:unnamed protein product [Symbiodinium natans]
MANVCVVDPPYSITRYYDYYDVQEDALKTTQVKSPSVFKSLDLYVDAVARPGITGLGVYCFLRKNSRFSNKIRLHRWSRWTTLFMALCVADQSVAFLVERLDNINNPTPHETVDSGFMKLASTSWVFVCNALQVYITNLKLQVLGLRLTAWICQALLLLSLGTGAYEILSYFKIFDSPWTTFLSFAINVGGVLLVQCIALCSAATRALLYREGGESIRCFAFFLYVNGVLAIAGPLLSYISVVAMWANFLSRDVDLFDGLIVVPQLPMLVVTLDNGLQVLGTLLLTGMLGPKGWERPMEAFRLLAHLSGFGLASKRIAFPGKINAQATKCIASFPGKYSAEWDQAVSSIQEEQTCSLACVFLTERASGLGGHADNPDTPGHCWCRMIYGKLPAETYLSVVDMEDSSDGPMTEEKLWLKLAFKKADADAMGQVLVIKEDQPQLEWEVELSHALRDAEIKCNENHGKAPWGCQWFEEWRKNVDAAVKMEQSLHVFYFESKAGFGKLTWEKLRDAKARKEALKNTGLGASQTAEVAYLEKLGLTYEEHDIREFQDFLLKPLGVIGCICQPGT